MNSGVRLPLRIVLPLPISLPCLRCVFRRVAHFLPAAHALKDSCNSGKGENGVDLPEHLTENAA